MTLYQISEAIRDVGHIWLIQYLEFGTLLGGNHVRIVKHRPGQRPPAEVPIEKNSWLHIVSDATALQDFLRSVL